MAYRCTSCEASFLKWSGMCANCSEWETLVEDNSAKSTGKKGGVASGKVSKATVVKDFSKVKLAGGKANRVGTGFGEFDRVLGGGIVSGEVVLVGGEPGVGKSTLLSQISGVIASKGRVLYVAGEESVDQLVGRMNRVVGGDLPDGFEVTTDVLVESLGELVMKGGYDLVIVDSIQSVHSNSSVGYPGGVSQVRSAGSYLVGLAKSTGIPIFIVGQINKDGAIAGPKVLEHMVDCVVYVDGGEFDMYRVVRCVKNRFGPTNEIGVFEMGGGGLIEVLNPSSVFLDDSDDAAGSALTAVVRGSRVVVVEVQALVVERSGGAGPMRRIANGIKSQRLEMLVAVLSKYGGLYLGDRDVFVNVVGGMTLDDPVSDLAICAAIKSSYHEKVLEKGVVYMGEVALTGGVRTVHGLKRAVDEVSRMGYGEVVVPDKVGSVKGCKVKGIKKISSLN